MLRGWYGCAEGGILDDGPPAKRPCGVCALEAAVLTDEGVSGKASRAAARGGTAACRGAEGVEPALGTEQGLAAGIAATAASTFVLSCFAVATSMRRSDRLPFKVQCASAWRVGTTTTEHAIMVKIPT